MNDNVWTLDQAVWRSRRGLLELDVLLGPFVVGYYLALSDPLKQALKKMLLRTDMELQAVLVFRKKPDKWSLEEKTLVKMIVEAVEKRQSI